MITIGKWGAPTDDKVEGLDFKNTCDCNTITKFIHKATKYHYWNGADASHVFPSPPRSRVELGLGWPTSFKWQIVNCEGDITNSSKHVFYPPGQDRSIHITTNTTNKGKAGADRIPVTRHNEGEEQAVLMGSTQLYTTAKIPTVTWDQSHDWLAQPSPTIPANAMENPWQQVLQGGAQDPLSNIFHSSGFCQQT